jgi:ribosomal protein S18 acetylase RimI-like enzyme
MRPARPADVPAIEDVVERAYAPYVGRIGRRPGPMDDDYASRVDAEQVTVAGDGEPVAGLVVLVPHDDHLLVENVAVDPMRQHAGVGRALLGHAEARASELGLSELRLYTNAAMAENLRFYPAIGYAVYARRRDDGFERVFFRKRLAPPAR